IARYFAPLADHPGAFGLIDDAAAITPPKGSDLVLTVDTLVGGIHFLATDPPDLIARKALRVNLSDLAAKGARPLGYLLSLALPDDWSEPWLERFSRGLREDQDEFGISLLGGDTVRTTGPLTLSITAFGSVPVGKTVRRNTVTVGDAVYVSGTVGDAALGLQLRCKAEAASAWNINPAQDSALQQRYLVPQPRLKLSQTLIEHASAAMDVSDGLVGDLAKMLINEGVRAVIMCDEIPLSDAARAVVASDPAALPLVLTGGDDYEILATVAPENTQGFEKAARKTGIAVRHIGHIVAGEKGVDVKDRKGNRLELTHGSYAHF
ncbi:MAG: thiamine-phosphate kinase, partial [Fimbriimonadaceae bacterium]|nr:thiamine-phosphate kinase [Alphaproteobacteria bacterium]